jgi:hypothetical protein
MKIQTEKISSINYDDIYQQNIMLLFRSIFTNKNIYVGVYRDDYRWNSRNEKKLGKYSLIISVKKYDMLILQTKSTIKNNHC